MALKLSLIMLMALIAAGMALTTTKTTKTTAKPKDTIAGNSNETQDRRDKRQLNNVPTSLAGGSSGNFPIFFDGLNPPVQPLQPLQPLQQLPPLQQLQPLQPITVVTPVASNSNAQTAGQQQPQNGWFTGFGQNLPVIGTLVGGLPNLINGLGLGSLNGGFGTLGGLNLGNLGLGAVTPVVAAPLQPAAASSQGSSCPLTQKLSCRCEPLIQLAGLKPSGGGGPLRSQLVQIQRQNARMNEDGSQEVRVALSSGHVIYRRLAKDMGQSGYLAMRIQTGKYLTIYYSVNREEYSVRADVQDAPPTSDLNEELSGQL